MMEDEKNKQTNKVMRKRETQPFYIPVMTVTTDLDWDQLHKFNDDFISRYAKELNDGRDLRFIFEFELSCFETGLKHFYLGQTYTNSDGEVMKVIDRREDMLIIKYDGDYYGIDYFHNDGMEYCVMEDTRWSAADTTQCLTNDGESKEEEEI